MIIDLRLGDCIEIMRTLPDLVGEENRVMDDLAALLADIERQHAGRAEEEAARKATAQQIARLNARTPRRGGADLAAGERDDDERSLSSERERSSGSTPGAVPFGLGFRVATHSAPGTTAGGQDADDARDRHSALSQQRDGSPPLAAEAPPPVPGLGAESQRSPEVDPYSPDLRQYSPEEIIAFVQRAIDEAQKAIRRTDHLFQENRP